ncbi:hypothetical protein PINS_up008948 [Pythium insidiosum]|nr:hypothetical protein PINS_up008948 [Pythium insidiosum]
MFGDFVLMSLFLALLLDNFDTPDETEIVDKRQEVMQLAQRMSTMKVMPLNSAKDVQTHLKTTRSVRGLHESIGDGEEPVRTIDLNQLTKELVDELSQSTRQIAKLYPPESGGVGEPGQARALVSTAASKSNLQQVDEFVASSARAGPPTGRALFLFSELHPIRRIAHYIVCHPWFDSVILVLISISSISLALDNPLANPDGSLPRFLKRMDNAFAVIFLIEMSLKIIANGLIIHQKAYLRNGWNVLDCAIVVSSIVMLVEESSGRGKQLKSLRSLRGLRTFRPLRMISRRPGLKLVVNALFEAIPAVLNVMFVCMLFYFIFSIIAVNYLKGALYSCQGDTFGGFSDAQTAFITRPKLWSAMTDDEKSWFTNTTCTTTIQAATVVTSRIVCECWGATWGRVLPQHFDNVISAMLTFFELSTTEGWADVMMAAVDARGIDMQPERDNNTVWVFFFVAFILIGSFFVVNLFVGIIIDNFNRMKAALGGDFMLTEEQKKWIEAQKAASRVGPIRKLRRPNHRFRGPVFDIVRHNRFEWFIMVCIIINTILMGSQYFGQPTIMINVVGQVNEVFAAIFTIEAFLKIVAYSSSYFWDAWNRFDFFVVMGTLLSVVIEWLTGTSVRSLAMLVRVIRVTRIIRLVKASKSIRQILLTLYIALPGLSNITSILFLMMFIYATMGVQLFAKVALHSNIDAHANFQGFWTAFLFLLRSATGEAWNSCMHDYASNVDGCVDDPDYNASMCGFNDFEGCIALNGCGSNLAYPYFLTFTLLVTYVMLNLTIAVILEGFSLSQEDEEPLIEPELLEEFQTKWADIDIEATGFIHIRRMRVLTTLLEPPLGHPHVLADKGRFFQYMSTFLCLTALEVAKELIFRCRAEALQLPMYDGDVVHFKDVLLAMAREMVKEVRRTCLVLIRRFASIPMLISSVLSTTDGRW